MKKLALTIICGLAVSGAAFAQGNVNWSSITFSSVTFQTNSTQISPLFGGASTGNGAVGNTVGYASLGTGYYYELLYNTSFSGSQVAVPVTLAGLATWWDAGIEASNSTTASRLSPMNPANAVQVPWSPGTTDNIVLVGWSANLGSAWTGAGAASVSNIIANWNTDYVNFDTQNSFFGTTKLAGYTTTVATSVTTGVTIIGNSAQTTGLPIGNSTLSQMYLLPVPEPATCALLGLGGLSMLLFRRRK
jgi:hypothetical protein